jgi:predicted HAD superfamily Cof-like phosphohydrolase
MNKFQSQVIEFHEKFGMPVNRKDQAIRRANLRAALIVEEAKETVDAILDNDIAETIDGLCDLIYVCVGAAAEFGVDLEAYFSEVHKTNMMKSGGAERTDGKLLKPEGWTPPQIKQMLAAGIGRIK